MPSGGDSTPIKGYSASSSAYFSNDEGTGLKVGTSGMRSETIGLGASLGIGLNLYNENLNDQYRGASQIQEVCFLVACMRYHQTSDGKNLGWGLSPLTEFGGGSTHFFNNTELYHAPISIRKKRSLKSKMLFSSSLPIRIICITHIVRHNRRSLL